MIVEAKDREEFLDWIVSRYVQVSGIDRATARQFAEANFDKHGVLEGVEVGDPEYGWTVSEAKELADEDMSCWEGE